MPDIETTATELKAQYAAQVAADLERNTKEQERIGTEVAALQEQLASLQSNQVLLANLQRTLGVENLTTISTEPEENATAGTPVPRQASARKAKPGKAATAKPTGTAAKNGTKAPAAAAATKQPTLVELIRSQLGQQSEPRSAAEITTALAQAHPDRDIKSKVVRVTVEGLVAKGSVQRSKQGNSVFYTTSKIPAADTPAEQKDPATA
ncbi:hypothetical protein [Streptomyces sp. NPDC050535]|uniref:hypothetical protein n=1 Tax=Streptomyces sp. NPDC050535 TaxID=3365626 RepID=UPI0037A306BF